MKRIMRIEKDSGFTIPEVIIAGTIMIVLCVGILTAFSFAVKMNRGNNLRMQALAVLQKEVEEFRSFKFIPVGSDLRLNAGDYQNYKTGIMAPEASDGQRFNISVSITNVDPSGSNESAVRLKQIFIKAQPVVNQSEGWLQNLGTEVTIQRVRSN